MSKDNGGPAFPSQTEMRDGSFTTEQGMTLRDYFAAKAMQGLISDGCLTRAIDEMVRPFNEIEVSGQAYAMADAMLAERAK